ncbi:hypothetical protein [Pseudomonas putida]|uniref:hypothetical protein n=1 Tax=Pseudomonas putida TaxID=303 RepID=UPI002658D8C3|nr:hypothetical protein [Pseudomonas putida]MCZ9636561.1 hypothetical protein [Pseudomonas putida]
MKARNRSAIPAAKGPAAALKPEPFIPLRNEFNEIDIEGLNGQDLETYINFEGIEDHEAIYINWRGASPAGVPIDDHESRQPVGELTDRGLLVPVNNERVTAAAGGWVFYSYRVTNEPDAEESLRLFCYVGVRDRQGLGEGLPVIQVRGAHDQVIALDELATAGVLLVVPAYQAMQVGDKVSLEVKRFDDRGTSLTAWKQTITVVADDLGKPLQKWMPKTQFNPLVGGRVEAEYKVLLAGVPTTIDAPMQAFSVARQPSTTPTLPAPEIEGHSGDELDPTGFKDGLKIEIPAYEQLQVGDHLLLNWQGQRSTSDALETVRMDLSSTESQHIVCQLGYEHLARSIGDQISVGYQYARQGKALASEQLRFSVKAPRAGLPAPNVHDAIAEGDAGEDKARIEAANLLSGATVTIPESAQIYPGESFEVHWDGHPGRGRYVTSSPTEGDGRTFAIPPGVIAANMEQRAADEAKRFPIFYRIKNTEGDRVADSVARNLRIQPLPRTAYRSIQLDLANAFGEVSLAAIRDAGGAQLILESWPFMAIGVLLTIRLTGIPDVDVTLRDAQGITQEEMDDELVKQAVETSVFERLALNAQFTVSVTCSFDEGEEWTEFTPLYPTLRA